MTTRLLAECMALPSSYVRALSPGAFLRTACTVGHFVELTLHTLIGKHICLGAALPSLHHADTTTFMTAAPL